MALFADRLKAEGNALFKDGDYEQAASKYTEALQRYSKNHLIFSNRSNCRLKLQQWEGALNDAEHSIELTGDPNFKAYYYMAEAQFALNHYNEALGSALKAYEQVFTRSTSGSVTKSVTAIAALIIKCKKNRFEARQRERAYRSGDLLAELEISLECRRRAELDQTAAEIASKAIGVIEGDERRAEINAAAQTSLDELRTVFAIADPANHARKEIPDWAIDTITFELMHDPVVTKHGHSYERATIMEHLKRSETDPLTRESLTVNDLRPNIALKKALEEFWENAQGWAVEW